MAVMVVPCPGCQSTLKAPENMAGKKAKCKKCGVSFRIPGGEEPSGDTASDGHMLSAMDLPVPADNPFDFAASTPALAAKAAPESPAQKSAMLSKPAPKVAAVPLPKPTSKSQTQQKPKEEVPAALPMENEGTAADPLSFDDNDEVPTVPAGDPFTFDASAASTKIKAKSRPKLRGEVDELPSDDEMAKPAKAAIRGGYSKGAKQGGIGKLILIVVVFGLVVGGVVGCVLIYLKSKKDPEPAATERKTDPSPAPVDPVPQPKPDAKGPDLPSNKGNEKTTPKKDPPGKKAVGAGPGPTGPSLGLPPGRTITFAPLAVKRENIQEPSVRLAIVPVLPGKADASFALARKVFPPLKRDIDVGVLWQTEAGFQNRGEKLLLGIYSPQTGKQANQVAFESDGSAEAACDLSVNADLFAHAQTLDNKITVWNTRDGTKAIDGFNPYADKKDLKLAAVYLTEPPDTIIAVSTTGAVHAFKMPTMEPLGEFLPTKRSSRPLESGKSIAPGPGRQSVVLVVGGTVYAVSVRPTVGGQVVAEIGGDVGRSFGLAASGSQKLLYAFETDKDNKKEKAVMELRGDGNHFFYRWPDKDAGDPTVVGWAGDDLAMVGTDRGACVWFEAEGTVFKPIGLARTPNDKARHVASDGHWTLLPDPADPKKCVLVEYSKPQSGIVSVLENVKLPPTVLLNDKGLFK